MIRLSQVAFAGALLSGASGLVLAVPAAAKEKAKEEAPRFKFSNKDFVVKVNAANTALDTKDLAAAEPVVADLEATAVNDDDKYAAAALRLRLEQAKVDGGQKADNARIVAPYLALLNNPRTPPANAAEFAINLGILYFNGKQFPQSVTYFEKARQLGSTEPNLSSNIAKARFLAGDTKGGLAEIETSISQQIAAGGKADEELYRFALSRSIQARDAAGTLSWIRRYLIAFPTAKNWRDMIKIYGLQPGSFIAPTTSQSLDLYRLMRATGALQDQFDFEDYARRAKDGGLPYETRTVITEGRAKGAIPAGSPASTSMLANANESIKSEGSLAPLEARSKTDKDGKLAAQTGDAQLGSGNYPKAIELYRVALAKGGANANDVNTRLGIALTMSGDKAAAKTAFAAVTGSPGADIAALWTTYLELAPAS